MKQNEASLPESFQDGKLNKSATDMTSSVNPLTEAAYILPKSSDNDRTAIDDFLARNRGKPVVLIQGLGFVGGVMSLVCANAINAEYAVIGVDLPTPESYWKVRSFNEGILPLKSSDPKVAEYFERARKKGNHYATFDDYAYIHADVVIVDVNLDVQKQSTAEGELFEFDVNLDSFSKAIETIANKCKPEVLIVVETTVPPGTCEKIALPILQRGLADRNLPTDSFRLGHSYERVMPGPNYIDSIQNFYRVFSGIDDESAEATEKFLKTIIRTDEYPLTRLQGTNATEMAKVLENSYRAMNIAFMVEWSRFAEEAGVNIYEVVNAIRMRDTHSNMMLPGIGVGGYCLTKDPLLASWARMRLFDSPDGLAQSEQGVRINDQMPLFAFNFLKQQLGSMDLKGLQVLLLGVSYRGDVGDTRYSPVELFCKLLMSAGCEVRAHDYFVDYWNECELQVETKLEPALASAFDVLAITTSHTEYRNNSSLLDALTQSRDRVVLDTVGVLSEAELVVVGKNHKICVLGRGDESVNCSRHGIEPI